MVIYHVFVSAVLFNKFFGMLYLREHPPNRNSALLHITLRVTKRLAIRCVPLARRIKQRAITNIVGPGKSPLLSFSLTPYGQLSCSWSSCVVLVLFLLLLHLPIAGPFKDLLLRFIVLIQSINSTQYIVY